MDFKEIKLCFVHDNTEINQNKHSIHSTEHKRKMTVPYNAHILQAPFK